MNKLSRQLQIGVIGAAADLPYPITLKKTATEIGCELAKKGVTLIFGAEKDYDSLPTIASRAAKKTGGLTIGITYGKNKNIFDPKTVDVVIASGLERGGGREFVLVLSCDALVALNGGSGTLTEIAIAVQANIPVVAIKNSGGWSAKLAGQYLDDRRRMKVESAQNPKAAVNLAIKLANQNNGVQK